MPGTRGTAYETAPAGGPVALLAHERLPRMFGNRHGRRRRRRQHRRMPGVQGLAPKAEFTPIGHRRLHLEGFARNAVHRARSKTAPAVRQPPERKPEARLQRAPRPHRCHCGTRHRLPDRRPQRRHALGRRNPALKAFESQHRAPEQLAHRARRTGQRPAPKRRGRSLESPQEGAVPRKHARAD